MGQNALSPFWEGFWAGDDGFRRGLIWGRRDSKHKHLGQVMRSGANRMKITDGNVPRMPSGHKVTWDTEIPGFGVWVNKDGTYRKYIYRYVFAGVQREYALGRFGVINSDQARRECKKVIGILSSGRDPFVVKRMGTDDIKTFAQLADMYQEKHVDVELKATSKRQATNGMKHLKKVMGDVPLHQLTKMFVKEQFHKMPFAKSTKAGHIRWARAMWNWAEAMDNKVVPDIRNPFDIEIRGTGRPRTRLLKDEEWRRLFIALDGVRAEGEYSEAVVNCCEFALYVPLRINEVQKLRWSNIDGDFLKVVEHKTDREADPILLPITTPIRNLLDRMRPNRSNADWLFPSPHSASGHVEDMDKVWAEVRKRAEVQDVTFHDVRRSWNSLGARLGFNADVMGKVLGNSGEVNRVHYYHVEQKMRAEVAEKIAQVVEGIRAG
jgi:integrase